MTHQHRDRPNKKPDLTRWNRAGLSKFDYVDGDAAVWLEELRIAMLGLYMPGADPEKRTPEHWRDAFASTDTDDWPDVAAAAARVKWDRLVPDTPTQAETRAQRTERLLKQYRTRTTDCSWEINRAMARASHILLGTLDAYANEGYLRSATQWDNLRRLAAMVNYQPTPPASATTTLALILKDDIGAVEIPRGLAMKHTPAEGGAPLIFETLLTLPAHPDLNAARAVDWNKNSDPIAFNASDKPAAVTWHMPAKDVAAPGDRVVVANSTSGQSTAITTITQDTDAQTATITLSDTIAGPLAHWQTRLFSVPDDVRMGLPRSKPSASIVSVAQGGYVAGDMVQYSVNGKTDVAEVLDVTGGNLVLNADLGAATTIDITPMMPFRRDAAGVFSAPKGMTEMHFFGAGTTFDIQGDTVTVDGFDISEEFKDNRLAGLDIGFVADANADTIVGVVKPTTPDVIPSNPGQQSATVSFQGKPPKGLAQGNWFIAVDTRSDIDKALQVKGVRVSSGAYHILFSDTIGDAPEFTEFHGPMTRDMAAIGFDNNPDAAMSGGQVTLENITSDARARLKPGRKMIITRTTDDGTQSALATLTTITPLGAQRVKLAVDPTGIAAGWTKGHCTFHLNTAVVSHGETKDQRVLGSGDGEQSRQAFDLALANVSHIPSSATDAGVIPDIDIAVDGERWDYRDFIDPTAEETRSWSTTLTEDGKLKIHFRRRLLTGQNNARIVRVRVGAGFKGSDIPPFSFEKPMKKDRYVAAVHQPFPTSGGADREPVSKLRTSAPSRLSANGRAVSLSDFEALATRHAAILRAHAEEVPTPDASRKVSLTLAPVGGGALTDTLQNDLRPAILNKAIPGTRVVFLPFQTLPLHVAARVRSDLTVNDQSDIKAAAEAVLFKVFALEARSFAQIAYISEVLAALETVPGIETAIVTRFDLGAGYTLLDKPNSPIQDPWPRNIATRDGVVAAIYATDHQIIHIPAGSAGGVSVVVEDIR